MQYTVFRLYNDRHFMFLMIKAFSFFSKHNSYSAPDIVASTSQTISFYNSASSSNSYLSCFIAGTRVKRREVTQRSHSADEL